MIGVVINPPPHPRKSKAKMPYHSQTVIFIRSRQKQQNVNEMLFVWMKGLASEPTFLWMKQVFAAGARQSPGSSGLSQWATARMTHSAKACSIVEGSISIKGGIFHPTAVWGKKKSLPEYKDAGRKEPLLWREEKLVFQGKSRTVSQVRMWTELPSWRWAVPPNFHSAIHLHQGATMNVPFGSEFIMNVQWRHIQNLVTSPWILFVKGM